MRVRKMLHKRELPGLCRTVARGDVALFKSYQKRKQKSPPTEVWAPKPRWVLGPDQAERGPQQPEHTTGW